MALDFSKSLSQALDTGLQSTEPEQVDNSPNILSQNLSDVLGPPKSELDKMVNFQNQAAYFNAQDPTPIPSGSGAHIPITETIGLIEPNTTLKNSAAMLKGQPLTEDEQHQIGGNRITSVMGTEAQGNTLPMMVPGSEKTAQPTQTPTAVDVNKIYNPFDGSQGLANAGIDVAKKAAEELSAAKKILAEKKYEQEEALINKNKLLQEAFDVKHQEKMDDLNSNIQEYRQLAGSKVIPGAFLARQDTQASIMTGLAVALGAAGQGLMGPGSSNLGIEMINKAIDRDVEAQRFNLDTRVKLKKLEADTNENLLSQMRTKFGDDKSAYLATKLSMTAMAEEKFNQQINQKGGAQDKMALANALAAKGQLAQQRESYEMQLRAAQQEQHFKMAALSGKNKKYLTTEEAMIAYPKDYQNYIYGYGPAVSGGVAKIMRETVVPVKTTLDKMDSVIKYAKNFSNLNLADRDLMTAKLRDLQLDLKNEKNYALGVLNPVDLKILQDVTGDPNNLNPFVNQLKKIQDLRDNTRKALDSKVRSLGFEPEETPESKINFK